MSEEGRGSVKGSILLSRLEFLRAQKGPEAAARVLTTLGDEDRSVLAGSMHPNEWYPFQTNASLDLAIAAEMQSGDEVFRALGAASAEHNLVASGQRHFIRDKNPHALLKHTTSIYGLYYDTGFRQYERVSDTKAVLRTRGSRSFSTEDCLTVVGWHERAIEMCGGNGVHVTELKCRVRGDEVCEYHCEWT